MGLATTLTYDWLTLRGGYFSSEVTLPDENFDPLAAGWDAVGYPIIADHTRIVEDTGNFIELGFQINLDAIIVVGEYTQLELQNTPIATDDSYYIMAGYQLDKVLLHLTYGVDESMADNYTTSVSYDLTDPASPINVLKGTTEFIIDSQKSETNYVTAGVRYDFHDSAALKVEYTTYTDDLNSNGDAGLFRVALVTVF